MQNSTKENGLPGGASLADRKVAVQREIEGYETQARFHNGAIHEMGRLVSDAKANVETIARCAYLASRFGYHTGPLMRIAQLAAQSDHECPELAPIAELAVLKLGETDDVVRLAEAAEQAQTEAEKRQVQTRLEQMRAATDCASLEEALERQWQRHPSLPR